MEPISSSAVRVLVAGPNPLLRLGIASALARSPATVLVGESWEDNRTMSLARLLRPDVVLLEHPGNDSLVAELAQQTAVVVLTHADDPPSVTRAVQSGANGYLVHGSYGLDEFTAAVLGVARGMPIASPVAASALVEALRRRRLPGDAEPEVTGALTARERQIMLLAADGLTNEEMGRELGLTAKTVKNHLQNIYLKLGVHSRSGALSRWLGAADLS